MLDCCYVYRPGISLSLWLSSSSTVSCTVVVKETLLEFQEKSALLLQQIVQGGIITLLHPHGLLNAQEGASCFNKVVLWFCMSCLVSNVNSCEQKVFGLEASVLVQSHSIDKSPLNCGQLCLKGGGRQSITFIESAACTFCPSSCSNKECPGAVTQPSWLNWSCPGLQASMEWSLPICSTVHVCQDPFSDAHLFS